MDDKFKEIEKMFDEFFDEVILNKKSDKEETKKIKKNVEEIMKEFNDDEIMLVTSKRIYIDGTGLTVSGLFYSLMKNLLNDIGLERLTDIFLDAVIMDDKLDKINKDNLNEILNIIKKRI